MMIAISIFELSMNEFPFEFVCLSHSLIAWSSWNPDRGTQTGKEVKTILIISSRVFFSLSPNNAKRLYSWQWQMAIGVVYLMRHPLKPFLMKKMFSSVHARSLFHSFYMHNVLRRMEYIGMKTRRFFWLIRFAQVNKYDCVEKFSHNGAREHTQEYRFPVLAHLLGPFRVQNSSIFRYFYVLFVSIFFRLFIFRCMSASLACLAHWR